VAARDGNLRAVQELLSKRIEANSTDFAGRTPLMFASANGHVDVIQALLRAGANVNSRSTPTSASSVSVLFADTDVAPATTPRRDKYGWVMGDAVASSACQVALGCAVLAYITSAGEKPRVDVVTSLLAAGASASSIRAVRRFAIRRSTFDRPCLDLVQTLLHPTAPLRPQELDDVQNHPLLRLLLDHLPSVDPALLSRLKVFVDDILTGVRQLGWHAPTLSKAISLLLSFSSGDLPMSSLIGALHAPASTSTAPNSPPLTSRSATVVVRSRAQYLLFLAAAVDVPQIIEAIASSQVKDTMTTTSASTPRSAPPPRILYGSQPVMTARNYMNETTEAPEGPYGRGWGGELLECRNDLNQTPLIVAAQYGRVAALTALIRGGSQLRARDASNLTAYSTACNGKSRLGDGGSDHRRCGKVLASAGGKASLPTAAINFILARHRQRRDHSRSH